MQLLFDQTPDSLAELCVRAQMPRYTASQIIDWVYDKGVTDPAAMTNLSKRNREAVAEHLRFVDGRVVRHQVATDETQKLLLQWSTPDSTRSSTDADATASLAVVQDDPSRQTETVMIPADGRHTACVSSQIGCPVGCRFCASGIGGLDGNLLAGQIVEQAYRLGQLNGVGRISNVVFMGMGEPLANFAAVTHAIRTLNADWGMGISARRITVSTVGLPQAIRKLVEFDLPVTLALSLHAPNDDIRRRLIPWAQYTSIGELIDACSEYFQRTGREITLEYILIRNVNDRPDHALELSHVARRLRANINLIRYNEVSGLPYERPTDEDVRRFQAALRRDRIATHIRASRGRDIAAACGQLRHEQAKHLPLAGPGQRY